MMERINSISGWEKKGNVLTQTSTNINIKYTFERSAGPGDTTFYFGTISILYPPKDTRRDETIKVEAKSSSELTKLMEEKINSLMKDFSKNYNMKLSNYEATKENLTMNKTKLDKLHESIVKKELFKTSDGKLQVGDVVTNSKGTKGKIVNIDVNDLVKVATSDGVKLFDSDELSKEFLSEAFKVGDRVFYRPHNKDDYLFTAKILKKIPGGFEILVFAGSSRDYKTIAKPNEIKKSQFESLSPLDRLYESVCKETTVYIKPNDKSSLTRAIKQVVDSGVSATNKISHIQALIADYHDIEDRTPANQTYRSIGNKVQQQFKKDQHDVMGFRDIALYAVESLSPGDKVHSPSGYAKVISVKGNKVIVRSNDPAGDFEYDMKDVSKENKND